MLHCHFWLFIYLILFLKFDRSVADIIVQLTLLAWCSYWCKWSRLIPVQCYLHWTKTGFAKSALIIKTTCVQFQTKRKEIVNEKLQCTVLAPASFDWGCFSYWHTISERHCWILRLLVSLYAVYHKFWGGENQHGRTLQSIGFLIISLWFGTQI